jgi:hypothetical protein
MNSGKTIFSKLDVRIYEQFKPYSLTFFQFEAYSKLL